MWHARPTGFSLHCALQGWVVVCVCVCGGGEPFALASGHCKDCLSVNLQLVFKVDSRKEKEGKQCLSSKELKIRDNAS